jgi:hypothetical protein
MRLRFDARLYRRPAVDAAVEAFRDLADAKVNEEPGRIVVALKPKDGAEDGLDLEFANFVLGSMRA